LFNSTIKTTSNQTKKEKYDSACDDPHNQTTQNQPQHKKAPTRTQPKVVVLSKLSLLQTEKNNHKLWEKVIAQTDIKPSLLTVIEGLRFA